MSSQTRTGHTPDNAVVPSRWQATLRDRGMRSREMSAGKTWYSLSRALAVQKFAVGCPRFTHSDAGVVVHPVRGRQQSASDRSCVPRCQVFLMVSRQPHADVAILVLHSSDVGRETFLTSQRWPVRPVVEGRSGLPLGMLGVAPAWAGCGGHGCSLRHAQGRMRIGGVPPVRGQPESLISPWQSRLRPSPANGLQDVCAGQISDAHRCQRTVNMRVTFVINAGRGLKQHGSASSKTPGSWSARLGALTGSTLWTSGSYSKRWMA